MTYRVEFSTAAEADLERLFDFFLKRELESASGDLDLPERALRAIKDGVAFLSTSLFACRKVGSSPFGRELVISFGSAGSVALYEITDERNVVVVGAVRHLREDDYH